MEKEYKQRPEFVTPRYCEASAFSRRKGLPTSRRGVKTKLLATDIAPCSSSAWLLNWNDGDTNNNNKDNNNQVRPVSASLQKTEHPAGFFAEPAFIPLEDVFRAYMDCRRNKRNSSSALSFEVNYEQNCVELWEEINNGTYRPQPSITFIVTRPVLREVFAASFRDRIVHHLIINRIEPLLESVFIDETSNCRKGKGTHYGIRTLENHIKECSASHTRDCWVLKLDIRSYFMSINKRRLCNRLIDFVNDKYTLPDKQVLLYLIHKTLMNTPEENCIRRSHPKEWNNLPAGKSLFTTPQGYGLPIGNLTSQIAANFFLNDFDHWLKDKFTYYGRYVDDFYVVSNNHQQLKQLVAEIKERLSHLELELHPDKIYLQHIAKGVKFIGAVIKPGRTYIANRSRNNFYQRIEEFNRLAIIPGYVEENAEYMASCLNSYFGMMKHYDTYGIRRKAVRRIAKDWWKVVYVSGHFEKISVKNRYKKSRQMRKVILKSMKNKRKSTNN